MIHGADRVVQRSEWVRLARETWGTLWLVIRRSVCAAPHGGACA